jgi:hypothetical protein
VDLIADVAARRDAHDHHLAVRAGGENFPEERVLHRQRDDVLVEWHV